MLVQVVYVNKSICRCGFPILRDEIPLGKEYAIDSATKRTGILICGGCGIELRVPLVLASQSEGMPMRPLPLGIFERLAS